MSDPVFKYSTEFLDFIASLEPCASHSPNAEDDDL